MIFGVSKLFGSFKEANVGTDIVVNFTFQNKITWCSKEKQTNLLVACHLLIVIDGLLTNVKFCIMNVTVNCELYLIYVDAFLQVHLVLFTDDIYQVWLDKANELLQDQWLLLPNNLLARLSTVEAERMQTLDIL